MSKFLKIFAILLYCCYGCSNKSLRAQELKDGDIIFQTTKSSQSKAIQLATGSKYSHVGIICQRGEKYFVYEAVQPVKFTALEEWIQRGESGHYAVKRLKDADKVLTKSALQKMREVGERFSGKNYDIYFGWSNDKIYCSELVWKIYKEALGIEVGKLQELRSFNLTNPIVAKKLKERYGNNIPLKERVISPESIYQSDNLITVVEN